ncbi:DUF2905 family protein [Candidatus Poribacteria bacterium]|nr:DUF2905 family protein [Candidatus Poribacteria bacterium]
MRELLGKSLIIFGVIIIALGGIILLSGRVSWLGKLPGDIRIKRDGFSFYFPITTCIIISIILTLLFRLLGKR